MKKTVILIIFLALHVFAQQKSASYKYLSPLPDSKLNSRESSIIFRGAGDADAISLSEMFEVTGSVSGSIDGKAVLSSDGKTVIFKPSGKYAPGETVTVKINRNSDAENIEYSFRVTPMEKRAGLEEYLAEMKTTEKQNVTTNISDTPPDDFPTIHTELYPENGDPAEGYIFMSVTNNVEGLGHYVMMLNNDGTPFHYRSDPDDVISDFKMQPNGLMTYAKYLTHFTYAGGGDVIHYAMDNSFAVVDSFQMGNGYIAESHGFRLMPNGHALLFGYDLQKMDLTEYGGYPDAMVAGSVIQELDNDKNVVFQWRSWDYYPEEEYLNHFWNTRSVWDAIHFNSIWLDDDGNILVTSNILSELTKINRQTGEIMWRLGGPGNDFTYTNDRGIDETVHCVTRLDNGNVLLFDNPTRTADYTGRAVEYSLDMDNMTATKVWEYEPEDEAVHAKFQGSAQRLPNGNTIIGWGNSTTSDSLAVTEVNSDGEPVMKLWFPEESVVSYRAFRYVFDGGAPIAEKTEESVESGNTYMFEDDNDLLGVDLTLSALDTEADNSISAVRYEYAPMNPKFDGKDPMILPVKLVMSTNNINSFTGAISFDTDKYKVRNPEDVVVYYRGTVDEGKFEPVVTSYDSDNSVINAEIDNTGEYIIGWPDFESIVYTPVPFEPINDTLVNKNNSVDIRWRPIGYIEEYALQVSQDENFTNLIVDESGMKEGIFTFGPLEENATYYWRAKSYNDAGESEWSEVYHFKAVAPYIEIESPVGGEEYQVGEYYHITWEDNIDEDVNLYLDNEIMSEPLLLGTEPSTGGFRWELDTELETGIYNIIIESSVNSELSVTSGAITIIDTLTSVQEHEFEQITDYALMQNYPNPFNPSTKIEFRMPEAGNVSLKVYDLLGREVATLINGYKNAGSHTVTFDAASLSSGIYFYSLEAGSFSQKRKMLLMK